MVMNSCCLVLVKFFHAVLERESFLVICVDVGFALLFYIIGFKHCYFTPFEHAGLRHIKYLNT